MSIFVIDLDGTLLSSSGELTPDVILDLINIQKKGNRIIVASGRTFSEAEASIKALELEKYGGAAVLADGQYIIDFYYRKRYIRERLMTNDILQIIKRISLDNNPVKVFLDDITYLIFNSKFSLTFIKYYISNIISNTKEIMLDINQIEQVKEADKVAIGLNTNIDIIINQYEVVYVNDKCRYEIKKKDVNKATSVKMVIGNREDDVFVFGNDENDICLFKQFQNSYVMDDSTGKVKEYAKHVITSGDGKGVSREIIRIVNKKGYLNV